MRPAASRLPEDTSSWPVSLACYLGAHVKYITLTVNTAATLERNHEWLDSNLEFDHLGRVLTPFRVISYIIGKIFENPIDQK